jgi:2-dehydro-3-deoxyphosphogluconate aldolase/(4S)-4-hydroxy-2-oxoglutarate aldolase
MVSNTIDVLKQQKIIPIVRVDSMDVADKIISYLVEYGFKAIEITLSIPNATKLMAKWSDKGIVVGAGTVLTLDQAKACLDANVSFVVSPIVVEKLPQLCHEKNILCALGAFTPTEVKNALTEGADIVKIFPIMSAGGVKHIKALKNIFPNTIFMPTGGINETNLEDFIMAKAEILGIGNSLIEVEDVINGNNKKIAASIGKYFNKLKELENE